MFKQTSPKVDFPKLEEGIYRYWEDQEIVEKYLEKNKKSKKRFSFLDGPITANNPMGVHHGWGRTYKDLWQRYYNLKGFRQRFQNGFDCQGLWVEVEVEKELGLKSKKDIENLIPGDKKASIAKFVTLCKRRVRKFAEIQTQQSKKLAYFMDWDNSYYTMSDKNNYAIWYFLKKCYQKRWIYKGRDSVPWCPRCETAISQHEMLTEDYKELTHESVFFKLPVKGRDFSLVAWTTTPWTIPANVALAVNPKFKYSEWKNVETKEKIVLLSFDSLSEILNNEENLALDRSFLRSIIEKKEWKKEQEYLGSELVGLEYMGPFDQLKRVIKSKQDNPITFHTVVAAEDLVVATKGTGILHIAPGAGPEDFDLAKKKNLPVISVIKDNADYLDGLGELSGKNAKNHPSLIIDHLKKHEKGRFLYKTMEFIHRYPACWRCKTELVWKVADEWYIAMDVVDEKDEKKRTLRQQMVDVAKKIKWLPAFGLQRELDWLKNMHDWLISKKNRYWGLALPIYECGKCGNFEVIGGLKELEKRAISGFDKFSGHSPHKPWIDEVKISCGVCGKKTGRIDDVGNPWLDAGIVPFSTFTDPNSKELSYTTNKKYWQEWFPADFITESFPGQFKNWFYSLIAMSTVLEKTNPFKTALGFATLLGEDGRPMHKSWGNAIEFNEGAEKIGVDVMRWTYVTQNPSENLLFGYKKTDGVRRRFHLKLWNVYNFFITYANCDNWEKAEGKDENKDVLDRWILERLDEIVGVVTKSLDDFNVFSASWAIEAFVDDLSVWYVRRIRDRVGPTALSQVKKNNSYLTLYTVLLNLAKILAPFLPYLSEEIYRNLTEKSSVHLENWPQGDKRKKTNGSILLEKMQLVRKICEIGHSMRRREKIRIRQPLSQVKINIDQDRRSINLTEDFIELIKAELNVKTVEVSYAKKEMSLVYDTRLSKELIEEGQARDIVRKIQLERKKMGCGLKDRIKVKLVKWPEEFTDYIKRRTIAVKIEKGQKFRVEKA